MFSATMRARLCAVLTAATALAALSITAWAAGIDGYIFKPMWSDYTGGYEALYKGYSDMAVSATREGGPTESGYGGAQSWTGEPVGYFSMQLIPGTYSMMYHEKDEYARFFMFGQVVPNTSPYQLTIYRTIDYQDCVTGVTWDPLPGGTWSQTFVAKGNWVSQVGLHQAIEFGPDVRVTIHENDPQGAQIGPARVIPTNVVNPSSAYWSAGEVPTVPGQVYCVNFHVQGGIQAFLGGARIQGGVAYPDGRSWKDYQVSNIGPVKCTIYQDTDGITTCVSTKKTNAVSQPLSPISCTVAGQTFTAKGVNLLSFSALLGSVAEGKMTVAVYNSPGPNGEGSGQVGLAKFMRGIEWNFRSGVVWKPGEVPLVEGQTYYIKLKRADGQPFTIYHVGANEYPGGEFYANGTATGYDLSTTICTETFPGSASTQRVRISNISVARNVTSATVSWNTDVPTTTNYVDWGLDTPYTQRTEGASGGLSHSVTLTGLQPNTQYHYRVVSKTAGRFDRYSRDFVFCTEPDQANMLANPGFETGTLAPWTAYTIYAGDFNLRNYPPTQNGEPSFFSLQAHTGNWFYGGARNGERCKGGVYQRVSANSGSVVRFRAWLITYMTDPIGGFLSINSVARVGIDPLGGTNPASGNVVWGPWISAQDVVGATEWANGKGSWTEGFVQTVAEADHVTVFMEAGSEANIRWTIWGFDDAMLTEATPQDVDRISDLAAVPDGTLVKLTDKIAIAGSSEVGANYIEEPDRTTGLRVESLDEMFRAYRVTVQGQKGTKGSGEVYLYNAKVMSATLDAEPGILTTVAKNINVKPGNVGMLMQVAGKINVGAGMTYYINDGSLPDPGLKLRVVAPMTFPMVGNVYSITGVVQLEGTSSNPIPVLCPRDDYDMQEIN